MTMRLIRASLVTGSSRALNDAPVNSEPEWQAMQSPVLVFMNSLSPNCCWAVSAEVLPSANWSNGALSETSVDSYRLIASPQNMEKLASMIVNWFVVRGGGAGGFCFFPLAGCAMGTTVSETAT